jgi:hypothetical protein
MKKGRGVCTQKSIAILNPPPLSAFLARNPIVPYLTVSFRSEEQVPYSRFPLYYKKVSSANRGKHSLPTLHTALHHTTPHHTTLHYTTLHHTTLHYTTLHYTKISTYLTHAFILLFIQCFSLPWYMCVYLYIEGIHSESQAPTQNPSPLSLSPFSRALQGFTKAHREQEQENSNRSLLMTMIFVSDSAVVRCRRSTPTHRTI